MTAPGWYPGDRFWAVDYQITMGFWEVYMGSEPAMTRPEQDEGTKIAVIEAPLEVMEAIIRALNEQAGRIEESQAKGIEEQKRYDKKRDTNP